MANRNYHNREGLTPMEQLVGGIIVLLVLIWFFVIKPAVEYVKQHLLLFSVFGIVILTGLIVGLVFYVKWKTKKKREKGLFEGRQIEKGLIKFVDRFGNERWGKPEEVKIWTKENEEAKEKEKLINQVILEINNFKPSRKYHNEFPYQIELVGYLKHKFPNVDIEKQKGSSRPDIVVEDVAIEIKGPTRHRDLDTIMNKCARYKQHFGEIVIVLFEVEVIDRYYDEWLRGVKDTFPNVKIIRK